MSYPRVFHVHPFAIHLFGLMIALGLIVGGYIALSEARRKRVHEEALLDAVLWGLVGGLVGARTVFVLFNPTPYLEDPVELLRIWNGGLSAHGALIGGLIGLMVAVRRRRMALGKSADAVAPGIPAAIAVGRAGCDIYGLPSTLPWAVEVLGTLRHPAQVYSILGNALLFWWLWRRRAHVGYDGEQLVQFAIGYSLFRFALDFTRGRVMWGPLSATQWVSFALILILSVLHVGLRYRGRQPTAPVAAKERREPAVRVGRPDDDLLQRMPAWGWAAAVGALLAVYYLLNAQQLPFAGAF